ncbi:hypothetical protein Gotur_027932 [Gossypium turneri]
MRAEERGKAESLDVHNSYSHGSTVIFGRLIRISKKRILNGEPRGYFWMRSCFDMVISIGSICLEFGELLVMLHYWC